MNARLFGPLAAVVLGTCLSLVTNVFAEDTDDKKKEMPLELMKKLAGTWTGTASHGNEKGEETTVTYKVTAAGSAVMETLFGGTPHEMITMYHQDGEDLILTHYCAAQNQPRMKASVKDGGKKLEFKFLDGTNLDPAKDLHMHEGTMHFVDADHIRSEWVGYVEGKPAHVAKFDLKRKKKKEE